MKIDGFAEIPSLPLNATIVSSIGVDFNDKTQPALFDISVDGRQLIAPLSIPCHVGELIEQKFLSEKDFNQNSGRKKATEKFFNRNFSFSSSSWNERTHR